MPSNDHGWGRDEGVSCPSWSRELCFPFSMKQYCLAIHVVFNDSKPWDILESLVTYRFGWLGI